MSEIAQDYIKYFFTTWAAEFGPQLIADAKKVGFCSEAGVVG